MKKPAKKPAPTIDPEVLTLKFDVDPYQGMAALITGVTPSGFKFVGMTRKDGKAVATYVKVK